MKRAATVFMFFLWLVTCQAGMAPPAAALDTDIVIGLNIPKTGPYKAIGDDEEKGFHLAIEAINEKGGLLGGKLISVAKDCGIDPVLAANNTREMIQKYNAVMVSGGVSSAVAIAASDVCQELSVPYMAGASHSNALTGHLITKAGFTQQKANRHTFRWFFNAWMSAKTLQSRLFKEFGKQADYFYITSDYTWGDSMEESLRWVTETEGCDTVGAEKVPLGTANFAAQLQNAQKAKPDVLVLALFGDDLVAALKQAQDMDIKENISIVAPLMDILVAQGAGAEAASDVISTTCWLWNLSAPGTKEFVDKFQAKYKRPPGLGAASAWVAVREWAAAVEKAGDVFSDEEIILALEGRKFTQLKEPEEWRVWDHQCITEVYVTRGKSPKAMANEWDYFDVVASDSGLGIMRTREENPVTLQPLGI
jgi:ABC-type branched-subunit amino acid transport system substrate-binding protein